MTCFAPPVAPGPAQSWQGRLSPLHYAAAGFVAATLLALALLFFLLGPRQ